MRLALLEGEFPRHHGVEDHPAEQERKAPERGEQPQAELGGGARTPPQRAPLPPPLPHRAASELCGLSGPRRKACWPALDKGLQPPEAVPPAHPPASHSQAPQVSQLPVVLLAHEDFWGGVGHGATEGAHEGILQGIAVGKPKICKEGAGRLAYASPPPPNMTAEGVLQSGMGQIPIWGWEPLCEENMPSWLSAPTEEGLEEALGEPLKAPPLATTRLSRCAAPAQLNLPHRVGSSRRDSVEGGGLRCTP